MPEESLIVGLKPWLPPPLSKSAWWTAPVAAERLAAVRIGAGLMLVIDVLGTYWPRAADLLGTGSVTSQAPFGHPLSVSHRLWLLPVADPLIWKTLLILWALSGLLLAAGVLTRLAAAFAWYLSMSLVAINPTLHNAGDQVRTILFLLLMVSPCDAVWSWRSLRRGERRPIAIYPWALRLLHVQMAALYFMNGLFKAFGEDWRAGHALAILLGDSGWIRWPVASANLPTLLLSFSEWLVMLWELAFPLLVWVPRTRGPALWFGVLFHIGTGAIMRVGMFPAYTLCLYLMFVPWEEYRRHWSNRAN
jgi:hypothetical protein